MAWYKLFGGFVVLLLTAGGALAQSEIYKCLDKTGRPSYTNIKRDTAGRNCVLVSREVSVVPAVSMQRGTPAGFPRVDPSTQKSRDEGRHRILQSELSNEQNLLKDAQQKLAEQEQVRNGDERNYQKMLDRLQPYKEDVDQHQKNVEALQKELSNLR